MPARVSEAFILRTYPLRESDLIVSFFTREAGKLRGVARRARSPQSRFGSGLERLSQINLSYFHRENRELMTLDRCELIHSQFGLASDYAAGVALDYIAEISEQLLPAGEPNERYFRLLIAVLDYLRGSAPHGLWPAVNYFTVWAVRLSGVFPEMRVTAESGEIAREIVQKPIAQLTERSWTRQTAQDLRRQLVRQIEEHIERRLLTPPHLEAL